MVPLVEWRNFVTFEVKVQQLYQRTVKSDVSLVLKPGAVRLQCLVPEYMWVSSSLTWLDPTQIGSGHVARLGI